MSDLCPIADRLVGLLAGMALVAGIVLGYFARRLG